MDPWYWLRDDDREDPEILAHLEAENAYTESVLAPVASLKDELFAEMRGRIKEDDSSVPQVRMPFPTTWFGWVRVSPGTL